jgi:Mitochondrial branched-chain alpha-ketoacid dehydrogenase kinase
MPSFGLLMRPVLRRRSPDEAAASAALLVFQLPPRRTTFPTTRVKKNFSAFGRPPRCTFPPPAMSAAVGAVTDVDALRPRRRAMTATRAASLSPPFSSVLTRRLSSSSSSSSSTPTISDQELDHLIHEASIMPQTSVSLQALMRTGQGEFLHRTFGEETRSRHMATDLVLIQVAGFLRRELPIRLAHRIRDLQTVPIFSDMASIVAVRDLYRKSFQELIELPNKITTVAQEDEMAHTLEKIYERHANVIVQMAKGAFEFRKAVRERGDVEFETQQEIHDFLDRFYTCRVGIRVLIGQYLALRQPPVQDYIGIICSRTSPYEIVKRAIDDAAFMCTRKYGDAPEVIMTGRLDLTFPYVPTHLRTCISSFLCRDFVSCSYLRRMDRLHYARVAQEQHASHRRVARR